MAKGEEPADKQRQLMYKGVEVHLSLLRTETQTRETNRMQQAVRSEPKMAVDGAKPQPAGIVVEVLIHGNSAQQRRQRVTTVRR